MAAWKNQVRLLNKREPRYFEFGAYKNQPSLEIQPGYVFYEETWLYVESRRVGDRYNSLHYNSLKKIVEINNTSISKITLKMARGNKRSMNDVHSNSSMAKFAFIDSCRGLQ